MSGDELSIPEETILAVIADADGERFTEMTDHDEMAAWLDARGLRYRRTRAQDADAARLRRLFGEGRDRPGDEQ
jgi:hypothetical protein